jgi:hypothetical protein
MHGVWTVLEPAVGLADLNDQQRERLLFAFEKYMPSGAPAAVIPRTSLFVNLSNSRGLSFTIAAALLSDIVAHDPTKGVVVGLVSAALDRVRLLKEKELEVIEAMQRRSFRRIYDVWVDEDELIRKLPGSDTEAHRRTLARMKSKGFLEEGAGKWRTVW